MVYNQLFLRCQPGQYIMNMDSISMSDGTF